MQLWQKRDELRAQGIPVFDFGVGDPIGETPLFIRNALKENVPLLSQYPTVRGIQQLRSAIAGYLRRRFQVDLNPDTEIIPANGSREAIYNIPFLLINPGSKKRKIIAPSPGFPVMERAAVISGGEYEAYPLNEGNKFCLELESLPASLLEQTAIAWLNYPHNPSGTVQDLEYFRRQCRIAEQYGIVLCSDECYIDLYFDNPPPSILMASKKRVLAFNSCSKRSGMTSYRAGYVAGDAEIIGAFARFRETAGTLMPQYTQWAAAASWSDDTHVAERRAEFGAKRELALCFLEETGFEYVPNSATFYFWIKCPGGQQAVPFAQRLAAHGIIVCPGDLFGPQFSDHFRLGLVPPLAECERAFRIWKDVKDALP